VENSARPEIWARDTVITAQLQEQNKQCKIIASFASFYQFFPLSWQKYFLPWQKSNSVIKATFSARYETSFFSESH